MKIHGWIAGCLLGCSLAANAGEVDGDVDYLLLTRENLPAPFVVIEGCMDNLDFDPESYESYMQKKKVAAWLPLVHVGGEVQQNRLNDYNYVDNYQVDYNTSGNVNAGQTFGGITQTGYDDASLFEVWAQWDLRNIVYDFDRQTIIVASGNEENENHFLYAEVSKRYGKLYSLLPDAPGGNIPARKAVQIIESAAVLDAMSGFMISDSLKKELAAVEAKPVIVPNGGSIKEMPDKQEETAPSIVEVDDGQDDTVEKAF